MFDFDGTLADTLPWMRSVMNELADEFGFRRVGPDEDQRFRHLHGMALLRDLNLPLWKLPRVARAMRKRMAAYDGRLTLFPGISSMLQTLDGAGIRLAIVSSNSRMNVERILGPDHTKLIAHFACGIAMFGKAAKLQQVVRETGIRRSAAIYVGDEVRDAEAARDAGVAFGAVTWGQSAEQPLLEQNPAEWFKTVQQVAERLC